MNENIPGSPKKLGTPVKRSWEEIVKASNGQLMFIPESLLETVKKWQENKKAFEDSLNAVGKQELEVSNMFQNLMFAVRKYAESTGYPDIWTKDIGFEGNALKEGKFIINISDGK